MSGNNLLRAGFDNGEAKTFSDKQGKSGGAVKQLEKTDKQTWLIISNAFNRDGRADSQTITDKIPHLLKLGVEPVALSALTGKKDEKIKH